MTDIFARRGTWLRLMDSQGGVSVEIRHPRDR
jgi:hypothetical protein